MCGPYRREKQSAEGFLLAGFRVLSWGTRTGGKTTVDRPTYLPTPLGPGGGAILWTSGPDTRVVTYFSRIRSQPGPGRWITENTRAGRYQIPHASVNGRDRPVWRLAHRPGHNSLAATMAHDQAQSAFKTSNIHSSKRLRPHL